MRGLAGFKETLSTLELGWPIDIVYVLTSGKIYLSVEESLDVLGIREHVQSRGWKKIESFLALEGMADGFIDHGLKKSLISHSAFTITLFSFPCSGAQKVGEHFEMKRSLKVFLLEKLHQAELTGKSETPSPKRRNTETPPANPDENRMSIAPTQPGTTPLSSRENISPVKHLLDSPLKPGKGTTALFEKEKASHADHKHGRRWKSRPLANRVRIQESTFSVLSRRVHRGSKEDFLSAFSCSVVANDEKTITPETDKWNGKFTVQDVIELTKLIHSNERNESLYDTLTGYYAAERHHMLAHEILQVEDNCSASDAIGYVRKKFPGLICSSYAVDTLKNKMKKECDAVLQPKRCATGWRVQPDRLHTCLQFIYPSLLETNSEWWKLYGDARTYGKQKSVAFAFGNLNNEHSLNGCSYQSPKEMWPVCLFYGGDSRLNLELNLQEDSGFFNNWVTRMEASGHSIYVIGDSMFLDAMADVSLDPTNKEQFSIYNHETVDTKGKVDATTGLRSELNRKIDRELPHAILKGLPAERYVLCVDHMMTRITERLLTNKIKSIYNMESKSIISKRERDSLVERLESNINTRGVRGGNFKFLFEAGKNKLQQVSLNKTSAQLISAPPSFFKETSYPHILDGVSQNVFLPKPLPPALKEALDWPTTRIMEYDCESLLWKHHFQMHEINRMEPTPVLVNQDKKGSVDPNDYTFGVSDDVINNYVKSADIFHGLMCFLYGSDSLTPYMIKCLDIVPIFLRSLPFNCMMRMSTEGGERMHYMHQQRFFQHSSRGGGWTYQDPLLNVFYHMYRQIRERVRCTDAENVEKFEAFVTQCLVGNASDVVEASTSESADVVNLGLLSGKRFILVGSFTYFKLNQDKLKAMISAKGGQVYNIASIPARLPVDIIVISTQKECDKGSASQGITTAFQRNWTIVSPQYVLDTQEATHVPAIEKYLLLLDNIQAAPGTSAVHTKLSTVAETRFKRCGAFRDLKQTLHCRSEGIERQPKSLESTPKRSHHKKRSGPLKRPPSAFAMFVKEMSAVVSGGHANEELSFKELQSILVQMYKCLPSERKEEYQEKGCKYYEEINQIFL